MNTKKSEQLWYSWFSGFVDGEGCFYINISHHQRSGVGYRVSFVFKIGLSIRDINILYNIKDMLKVGVVNTGNNRNQRIIHDKWQDVAIYSVNRTKDLHDVIVPIFKKYPLKTKKQQDFQTWLSALDYYYTTIHKQKKLSVEDVNWFKIHRIDMNRGIKSYRNDALIPTIS